MKIAITPINVGHCDGEYLAKLARKAEEVGLESVWTFEHVVIPVALQSRYPYTSDGKFGVKPEESFLDPLISIAYAAGQTSTLRFGTGINILPQANPLLLAKQVASIDALSRGRLLLGLGSGWMREEYAALGTPFAQRDRRFDEYLIAMKKVWSGEQVEHEGEFLNWSGFKSYPLPVQRPNPPIIIGGASKAALERVARYGDGWFVPGEGLENLKRRLGALAPVLSKQGRSRSSVEVSATWLFGLEGPASLARYRDLGVARLIVPIRALGARDPFEGLDKLGEALVTRVR